MKSLRSETWLRGLAMLNVLTGRIITHTVHDFMNMSKEQTELNNTQNHENISAPTKRCGVWTSLLWLPSHDLWAIVVFINYLFIRLASTRVPDIVKITGRRSVLFISPFLSNSEWSCYICTLWALDILCIYTDLWLFSWRMLLPFLLSQTEMCTSSEKVPSRTRGLRV